MKIKIVQAKLSWVGIFSNHILISNLIKKSIKKKNVNNTHIDIKNIIPNNQTNFLHLWLMVKNTRFAVFNSMHL